MEEATARNIVLHIAHDRIPSYAIWEPSDIEKETIDFRIEWWKKLLTHENDIIVNMALHWMLFLNKITLQS